MSPREPGDGQDELIMLGLGWRVRAARVLRAAPSWSLSLLGHAVFLALIAWYAGPSSAPPVALARTGGEQLADAAARARRPVLAQHRRVALLRDARAQKARGELRLGAFLLVANAIDAESEGAAVDLDGWRDLYRRRVASLREELAGSPPEASVPEVFADIGYTGTPGGRMSEALVSKRGSCEPVSHLVAAALYDAGLGERSRLRFYGAPLAGVTHITPVLVIDGPPALELDLMTGAPSEPGGVAFPASELIEAYARAHGLGASPTSPPSAPTVRPTAGGPDRGSLLDGEAVASTRTMTSGYPSNDDRFHGVLPLYAERAIAAAAPEPLADPGSRPEPPPCPFYVSVAWLDPPRATIASGGSSVRAELVRAPSLVELERLSTIILSVESRRGAGKLSERLIEHACLAALYDHAGLAFSLAAQPAVAERAARSGKRERGAGRAALAELGQLSSAERSRVRLEVDTLAMGRGWILLFLDGGEATVLEIAQDETIKYGRTMALMALLVAGRTRERAVRLADALPLSTQVDLMHELTHAHDHARPWAASYALDLEAHPAVAELAFARRYRVFTGLAWRLWDAASSSEDTVSALVREADRAGLDADSRRAIGVYYLKHFFRLYHRRDGGPALIARASEVLEKNGLPGVSALAAEKDLSPAERDYIALPPGG